MPIRRIWLSCLLNGKINNPWLFFFFLSIVAILLEDTFFVVFNLKLKKKMFGCVRS